MNTDINSLHPCERWLLGIIAIVVLVVAGYVFYAPPLHVIAAQAGSDPTISVSSDPANLVVAMFAVSMLLLFIAVNGRRVASIKLPGGVEVAAIADEVRAAERTLAPKIDAMSGPDTDEEPEPQLQATPSKTVQVNGVELGVYVLDAVPVAVLRDFLKNISDPPRLFAVEFVARKSGRGNHPWAIKFRGDERIWKVAYGGQGKTEATVTLIL